MILKKLGKLNFVPVLNGSVLNCATREDLFINKKRATFYTKDGMYDYKTFLVNPFHHKQLWEDINNKGLIDRKNSLIFADSGGLQEVNLGEKKHSPEEVFKWQEKYCDVGFSFDSIPFKNETGRFTGWVFDGANFLKHAKKSRENVDMCEKLRTNDKFMYYGIVQGRCYKEYTDWYNILNSDFLDGVCVKTPNNNPLNLAETAVYAIHNIKKPIHFLGVGNQSKSIIAMYASKYIKQPVSFDSSSYDIGTQYRSYLLPFMINRKIRFVNPKNVIDEDKDLIDEESIFGSHDIDDLNELCDCVVCRSVGTNIGKYIEDNAPILGSLISIHNLIMNIKWNNYMLRIMDKRKKLMEFIDFNFQSGMADKIKDGIEMIDLSIDRGPEYALDRYKDKININIDISKQKNIFQF